ASRNGGRVATFSARALIERGPSSGARANHGTSPQRTVPMRRGSPLLATIHKASPRPKVHPRRASAGPRRPAPQPPARPPGGPPGGHASARCPRTPPRNSERVPPAPTAPVPSPPLPSPPVRGYTVAVQETSRSRGPTRGEEESHGRERLQDHRASGDEHGVVGEGSRRGGDEGVEDATGPPHRGDFRARLAARERQDPRLPREGEAQLQVRGQLRRSARHDARRSGCRGDARRSLAR